MTGQLITFVTATAPFACMAIAAACVTVMFCNLRARDTTHAHQSFGQWPETPKPASPQTARTSLVHLAALAKRLSLGLAAGIAVGEVLFRVIRGSVL
ncbi:hypothetical protein [Roseibium album]|uniref:hypothetical protein n=1 Tax=Roseibium album TaxID=311410 RepID=UPI0024900F0B|nr:hypothetical protein [Roseibium album]